MGEEAKRRAKRKSVGKTSSKEKLGIVEVERQFFRDRLNNMVGGEETMIYEEHDQSFLDAFIIKRSHAFAITRLMKSIKWLRKAD